MLWQGYGRTTTLHIEILEQVSIIQNRLHMSTDHPYTCIMNYALNYTFSCFAVWYLISTMKPGQNGRHFPDDIFKCIFLNENVWISLKISQKFASKVRTNNIPALVQIMAWRRPGAKPLSEPMTVSLLTHICVTRPQWVNTLKPIKNEYCIDSRPNQQPPQKKQAVVHCNFHSIITQFSPSAA